MRGLRLVETETQPQLWVSFPPPYYPPSLANHPSIRKLANLMLALEHDDAARFKVTLALYRRLGVQSQTTLGRIARDEWARAVKLAERNGVDWRSWLAERRGASTPPPSVRGPDAPPSAGDAGDNVQ